MARTLLLGLDGATFTVLDPLMERGLMPFLAGLVDRGVRAPLRSIVPPLTPPAWTSVMTGKRPGQHGVFDFFQKESPESEYYHFASSQDVRSETIWSIASTHGKRVVSLNFPLMFPPPPVAGYIVPGGWMPWRQLRLGCYPPGLFDQLKTLPSFDPRELALDMTLEAKAIEGCAAEEYADWIRLHTRREQRWSEILRFLLAEDDIDLVGVIFDGADKLQHLCWRFLDPASKPMNPTPWEQEIIDLCEQYFHRLDATLADLVSRAGDDVTVVVVSDHGFGPSSDVFYINSWLEQEGFLAWKDSTETVSQATPQVGFASMTRHVFELDWDRTVVYCATPSSMGINIVTRAPGSSATSNRRDPAEVREELIAALRSIRHPSSGRPFVTAIHTREAAFAGPYEQLAPDLTLTLADGAGISILRADTLFRERDLPIGNHRWDGIFIANGPGIRAGRRLDEVSLLDVAPLVLYSLDLPIPTDIAGRIPEAALAPDQLSRRGPRWLEAGLTVAAGPAGPIESLLDEDAEATILSRLRALGYVE